MRLGTIGLFAICLGSAALGFALAFLWMANQSDKAPEFYGAFAAAIIAAAALILNAFYQDNLNRQRDKAQRNKAHISDAIDLCFWLDHAVHELEFIASVVERFRKNLADGDKTQLEMPLEQFREVISSHFFEELLSRAKIAAQLPADIAGTVTRDIYETYTATDRIFKLRGVSGDFRPTLANMENYVLVLNRRMEKLLIAAVLVRQYLVRAGALAATD